jgi:hypothetical protein
MANFRRRKPRARTPSRCRMWHNPKWHDLIHHTRPHRRDERVCLAKLKAGADPDGIAWPVWGKPVIYYW